MTTTQAAIIVMKRQRSAAATTTTSTAEEGESYGNEQRRSLSSSSLRARGRWKLLRQAILKTKKQQEQNPKLNDDETYNNNNNYSIHSFAGYRMLHPEPRTVTVTTTNDPGNAMTTMIPQLKGLWNVTDWLDLQISLSVVVALLRIVPTTTTDTPDDVPSCSSSSSGGGSSSSNIPGGTTSHALRLEFNITGDDESLWLSLPTTVAAEASPLPQLLLLPATGIDRTAADCHYDQEAQKLFVTVDAKTLSKLQHEYIIKEYENLGIVYRERQRDLTRMSLQELTSHHHQSGVDNTGNVCVWDCEKTLLWALLLQQEEEQEEKHKSFSSSQQKACGGDGRQVVLELGAGMAGLCALGMLASRSRRGSATVSNVYITDGHADCIFNNQVNVRLMDVLMAKKKPDDNQQQHRTTSDTVECLQLPWSIEYPSPARSMPPADLTVVADCTHFQEHHHNLFWTMIVHTRVHGEMWMCQPHRGNSWQRFARLLAFVNEQALLDDDDDGPMLEMHQRTYHLLDQKHQEFLRSDNTYNPDIHRPHIFVITKLREATDRDRQSAIRHMHERDQ